MDSKISEARLHDRDPAFGSRRADRARRAAQAAARIGRLRLSRRARARRGVPGTRAGLRLRPARQSDHGRARGQGQRDGGRRRDRVLRHRHGGDRRDPARAAARQATTSSRASSCSATPTSLFATLKAHGAPVTFVDATDARDCRGGAHAGDAARVRRDDRQSAHAGRRPCAHRRALRGARHPVYVVDNTMTSPWLFRPKAVGAGLVVNALTKYIGGHGNALGRQRHRHRPLRLDALPEHRRQLQDRRSRRCGASQQVRKKGLRDWGGTLAAEQAHHICGRRGDARAADGAHLRERAGARGLSGRASAGRAPSTTRGSPTHPQHALASNSFSRLRRLAVVRARRRASTCFEFLNRLAIVVLSSNLGDNRTLAIPVAHTIFWEMGAGAPRGDGHRRFADPRLGAGSRIATTWSAISLQALAG